MDPFNLNWTLAGMGIAPSSGLGRGIGVASTQVMMGTAALEMQAVLFGNIGFLGIQPQGDGVRGRSLQS